MHKKSRGTAGFLSVSAYMPEYWRMVRDCNSHELRSRAPFTARAVCACSEPGNFVAVSNPMPITTKMKHPSGCLIFVADGEGFEPPDGLPRQRFSRPPHSTALPTILNFLFPSVFQPTVLFAYRTWRCCSPLVRARLRNLLALLTRTQDRRYCPVLPTILNFLCLAYSILIFSKTQINFKIQKIFIKKTLALYALNILTFV